VKELGARISEDYKNSGELVVVGILHGAFLFMADLVREIKDVAVRVDFMSLSSYGNTTVSSGAVKILMDLKHGITGKDVLVVEDIIDSGLTLKYLTGLLSARQPKSLSVCVMTRKDPQEAAVDVKYVGFGLPKEAFAVGYGLDYAGQFRCLPYIGELKPSYYQK